MALDRRPPVFASIGGLTCGLRGEVWSWGSGRRRGLAVAAPAVANPAPEVRWRLASAFHPSLDFLFGGAQTFGQSLSDMTDGQFTVAVSAAGEIAPALEALDAVADGKAECAHTALSYSWNREPAYISGQERRSG